MLRIPGPPIRLCEGLSRRDILRAGALGWLGLSLPELLRLQASEPARGNKPSAAGAFVAESSAPASSDADRAVIGAHASHVTSAPQKQPGMRRKLAKRVSCAGAPAASQDSTSANSFPKPCAVAATVGPA